MLNCRRWIARRYVCVLHNYTKNALVKVCKQVNGLTGGLSVNSLTVYGK